jgi:tetratricopeptide (TPR) repeat protein
MDTLLIFAAMLMVYIYAMTLYFYKRSKERQKKKSDLMIRAITYFRRKNYEKARFYFEEAYTESVEFEDVHMAAECLYYLAFIYNAQGDNQLALELLKESLDYYEYLDDDEWIKNAQILMSKIP